MSFWNDFFKLFTYGPRQPLTKRKKPEPPKAVAFEKGGDPQQAELRWIEAPKAKLQDPMSLNEYQRQAFTVAKYPEHGTGSVWAVVYCGLGLGEAGEVQGKIKKVLRDSNGQITPEMKEAILAEAGDTLWYIAALATELGVTLEEVCKKNLDKLFDRRDRGVIGGSGDNR